MNCWLQKRKLSLEKVFISNPKLYLLLLAQRRTIYVPIKPYKQETKIIWKVIHMFFTMPDSSELCDSVPRPAALKFKTAAAETNVELSSFVIFVDIELRPRILFPIMTNSVKQSDGVPYQATAEIQKDVSSFREDISKKLPVWSPQFQMSFVGRHDTWYCVEHGAIDSELCEIMWSTFEIPVSVCSPTGDNCPCDLPAANLKFQCCAAWHYAVCCLFESGILERI